MSPTTEYRTVRTDPDEDPWDSRDSIDDERVDLQRSSSLTIEERKRIWWRDAVINMMFIAVWFTVAIVLTAYNKWMFSEDHYGFSWPLFVTMLHMFVQFGFAALVRKLWPGRFRPSHNPNRKDYVQKVVPTSVATGLDIGLSNMSLKIITLSFYTMCKSSSLIFVLVFAFFFKLEKFSWRLVGVIFLVFAGVLMMVATETHFVALGFILITTASALSGLRWSLTHLLLKNEKMGMNNPAATIFWLAPMMGCTLFVVSFALESWMDIFASKFFDGASNIFSTILFLLIPGGMAFLMVLTEYYIIQRAGVLPMSIAGIAKEVSQISVSAWLFGDELTPLNFVGVAITVCGIVLFTYHKYLKSVNPDFDNSQVNDRGGIAISGSSLELEEQEPLARQNTQDNTFERDDSLVALDPSMKTRS
ncbi:TPT-domain-containing [Pyrrhoderma noxium]|uniref:TPT-domain-containing n=1 Tax=Pyrrhoderma noxium TaxID=2282107 RepID=A0A286UFW6_9AGAM|nr:TPT-domain-containing [Pyrrhoderma noxium]